jgi:hypothetical protein
MQNFADWNDQKRAEYVDKAKAALAGSPRYSASVTVTKTNYDDLVKAFPKDSVSGITTDGVYAINQKFDSAEEILEWFERPTGYVKSVATKFYVHDRLRTPNQGSTLTEKTGAADIWGPWLAEATIEDRAKYMFTQECRHDIHSDQPEKQVKPGQNDASAYPKRMTKKDGETKIVNTAPEEAAAKVDGYSVAA